MNKGEQNQVQLNPNCCQSLSHTRLKNSLTPPIGYKGSQIWCNVINSRSGILAKSVQKYAVNREWSLCWA